MKELDVRIVRLEPTRVASFYGFGQSPEFEALEKLITWAKPKGMLEDRQRHRIFGFNNPGPSHGSPNYGYEFWITVGPEVKPEVDFRIQEFLGGLYAVTRCQGVDEITETWHQLAKWLVDSSHKPANQQCLEEHLSPLDIHPYTFDLYAPIIE